jgi:hypothetical protein
VSSIDLNQFESEMWSAVADLEEARRALDTATRKLAEQREATSFSMQRYGAALTIEQLQVSREVVRSLYWEHRDIHAQAIADAFAIKGGGGRVHEYAGSEPFETPCAGGCGIPMRLTARTAPIPTCEDCAARQQAEREEHWRRAAVRQQEEQRKQDEWVRQQLLEGRTTEELYVEMTERWTHGGPLSYLKDMAAMVEAEGAGPNPF